MKINIRMNFRLAAVVGLLAVAAPADRAQAVSLINPAASASTKQASENITTEVRWHGHHRWHRHHGWRRHHGWHHRRHWHHRHHWHRRHHWY